MIEKPKRLLSLDILRGFDLFMLVVFCPILLGLKIDAEWYRALIVQFNHVSWEGFHAWDLVMPLFMFMSGVTIPFAMARYRDKTAPRSQFFGRLLKRFVLLWILGMVVQGNLLSLSPSHFKFYSNTLQAIAMGYLFSALFFVYLSRRTCYIVAGGLLVTYWAVMTFVGSGDYEPLTNIARQIDMSVLGRYMDGAGIDEAGNVAFPAWYFYSWVLSSLTFIVTVMSGMFAGMLLRTEKFSGEQKALRLAICGAICVALGWTWDAVDMPVIKSIWTSSMVLVSSGYCLLLLSLFYYLIDVKGRVKGVKWLSIYGMNSILAYSLSETPYMRVLARSLSGGLKQYTGDYFSLVVEIVMVVMIFFILRWMYKNNKFLRV